MTIMVRHSVIHPHLMICYYVIHQMKWMSKLLLGISWKWTHTHTTFPMKNHLLIASIWLKFWPKLPLAYAGLYSTGLIKISTKQAHLTVFASDPWGVHAPFAPPGYAGDYIQFPQHLCSHINKVQILHFKQISLKYQVQANFFTPIHSTSPCGLLYFLSLPLPQSSPLRPLAATIPTSWGGHTCISDWIKSL